MEFNLLYLRATLPSLLKIQTPAVDLPLQSTVRAPPRGQKDSRAELANNFFPKKPHFNYLPNHFQPLS